MLTSGTILQNRYCITQSIGGGGMGVVYLAEDTHLPGHYFAVKEMSPAQVPPQDRSWVIDAFRQEAQMLANLNHPGLVRVTDHFQEGSNWYLVMDYVQGQTLESWLQQLPLGLPIHVALNYVEQLCNVLEYLHNQAPPVIFRDLKPGNVMVTTSGEIKLIDFGIARFFKPGQTHNTVNLGTPGYASPEHSGQGQTDPRSDIYSLGVMLHQMVTGHDPTATPFNFPSARSLNANVPQVVEDAIRRATQLQPARRFQTAAEFRQALIIQPSRPSSSPKSTDRPKWVYVIIGVVAVALTVVVGTWYLHNVIKPTSPSTPSPVPSLTGRSLDPSLTMPVTAHVAPDKPTPTVVSLLTPMTDPCASARQAVKRFQELRAYAQHTGDTSQYPSVLKGNALDSAIKSVEDYQKQGCYMDIVDRVPMTVQCEEVSGARAGVIAQRSETRTLICPKSTKYYCESYEGYYAVERSASGWFITDKGVRNNQAIQPCP